MANTSRLAPVGGFELLGVRGIALCATPGSAPNAEQQVAKSLEAKALIRPTTRRFLTVVSVAAQHSTWLRSVALWAIALVILLVPVTASAADLKPETLKTWREYVEA